MLLTTDNLDTRRRCCWCCCESDWLEEPPSCEEGVADKEAAEDDELSAERLDPANIKWKKSDKSSFDVRMSSRKMSGCTRTQWAKKSEKSAFLGNFVCLKV